MENLKSIVNGCGSSKQRVMQTHNEPDKNKIIKRREQNEQHKKQNANAYRRSTCRADAYAEEQQRNESWYEGYSKGEKYILAVENGWYNEANNIVKESHTSFEKTVKINQASGRAFYLGVRDSRAMEAPWSFRWNVLDRMSYKKGREVGNQFK